MASKRSDSKSSRRPCLSKDELRRLLSHVHTAADCARQRGATRPVVDELLVLLLVKAGLRPRELCALRVAHAPAVGDKPELRVRHGRGDTARVVEIPPEMAPLICRFVRLYRKDAKPEDPLFLSERGTPFSYMSLYSKVRRIGREAGLGQVHPGILRRTFLTRLYERERDLRLVQEQAGHASLKTTALQVRPHRSDRRCDACYGPVPPDYGAMIDSGQLLCPDCLRDLRNRG